MKNRYLDKDGKVYEFTEEEIKQIMNNKEYADRTDNYRFSFCFNDLWLQREITPAKKELLKKISELQEQIWKLE